MSSPKLTIASYNVHSWIGRDGRRDPERVLDVVDRLEADVVALQEAEAHPALDRFCEARGYEIVEGPTLRADDDTFGNTLLSQYPVLQTSRIDLSVPGREPRGALGVDLGVAGRTLQVVATHLGLRAREREQQVGKLLDFIGDRVARAAPDVLSLVGDFNEWRPGAAVLRRIEAAFGRVAGPRTFPSARPWLKLDRIWMLPRSAMRGDARVDRSPAARLASDHLPVVAECDLRGVAPSRSRAPG